MADDTITRTAYCPRCDAKRAIRFTALWQADLCTDCGANVTEEGRAGQRHR